VQPLQRGVVGADLFQSRSFALSNIPASAFSGSICRNIFQEFLLGLKIGTAPGCVAAINRHVSQLTSPEFALAEFGVPGGILVALELDVQTSQSFSQ